MGHKMHPYSIFIVLRVNVIFADDLAANVDRSAADIIWIRSAGVYRICRTVLTNTKKYNTCIDKTIVKRIKHTHIKDCNVRH